MAGSRDQSQPGGRREGLRGGVKWAPTLINGQGAGLPPRDHCSDRNEQHRATLKHHPANAVRTRRVVRSGACTGSVA
jgi:hypothetical protein